jgi:Leucine-rich repeat (LRR) protein
LVFTDYNLPVLEELLLSCNQLDAVPNAVFKLPSLVLLDVSNNKISELPFCMWTAPRLRDLNASWNLLSDLPSSAPSAPPGPFAAGPKRSKSVENLFASAEFKLFGKGITVDGDEEEAVSESGSKHDTGVADHKSLESSDFGYLEFRDSGNVK